jgi:hypothetical protein
MSVITRIKLFKQNEVYHVKCYRRENPRPAKDCYTCSRFIDIDPVKAEIKCREE